MTSILNTLQEIIRNELRSLRVTELALVESVFPHSEDGDDGNYACDVRLKNSGLLLRRAPVATGHLGSAAIPNVGDLVLLAFEQGDVNQPFVIGRLYNDDDRPPLNRPDELIFRLPLSANDDKTVMCAIRNFGDADSPRELLFEMPPKIPVHINDGSIRATAGKIELRLDQAGGSGGTAVLMAGRTKITLYQDGDLNIEAAGAISLRAANDLTLEGQNVRITGRQNVDISAQMNTGIKANMGTTVDGGLAATVQGVNVAVKGITSFSP